MTENKPPTPAQVNIRNRNAPSPANKTQAPRKTSSPPRRQGRPQRDPGNGRSDRRESFLNPYTFVPAFPRDGMTGAFADAAPQGADRLHEGNWTGTIAVTLTVRTPLLLLDTARAHQAPDVEDDHLVYPVLLRDGGPHLPATALKGMLRASYEAITNSRFGVFTGHDEPLGWRRVADDARSMKPVRVTADGRSLDDWESIPLPSYGDKVVLYPDGKRPKHGDPVWVKTKGGKNSEVVTDIRPRKGENARGPWTKGYAYITGRNTEKKSDERVFVEQPHPSKTKLTKELRSRWDALMEHHRKQERDIEADAEFDISPHRNSEDRRKLAPGTFCWAFCGLGGQIEALYPVMIPRDLAVTSPAEMVPSKVEPASDYRELSPADRVFGWVAQEGSGTRPAAYRGRLRISDVTCATAAEKAVVTFPGRGLPLAILAQPKPTQGRFYLSRSAAEPHRPIDDGTPKAEVHRNPDRALRGRKVYWHHKQAAASDAYWTTPSSPTEEPTQQLIDGVLYREYRRPSELASAEHPLTRDRTAYETAGEPQRDKQNRSVLGWIAEGTEFTFTIGVRDIPEVELGALLWLLTLDEEHHHRLGLGKPLGFGSVHIALDPKRTKLHTGAQWAEYYRDLAGELPASSAETVVSTCVKAFAEAAQGQPGFAEIEKAFRAAAKGRDGMPVHYPRARPPEMRSRRTPPSPAGESFAWFTANEKVSEKRVMPGRGRSLPAAGDAEARDLDVFERDD